tara:strand:- start:5779 stop:6807 length:1029 start_codon:yes stop_codon:yes gene_type:complete
MKNISLNCYFDSDLNDNFFKSDRIWMSSNSKSIYKDDKNKGFSYFGSVLKSENYNVHTQDFWKKNDHIDLQINFAYHQEIKCKKSYLLLPESKEIFNKNDLNKLKKKYTKIFCQYDEYIDNNKIFKLNYPFIIKKNFTENFTERSLLSCMISSNKSTKKKNKYDLYKKRFDLIKFAEKKYLDQFELYGIDWDLPFKKSGLFGRILNFKDKLFKKKNILNCYKGVIKNKSDILRKTKFVFCIENSNSEGYISDPIFDAFNNGCVPIYLGAKNVLDYIPKETFIDMRKFSDLDDLFKQINKMNSEIYTKFQNNIIEFLNSDKIIEFNEIGFTSRLLKHLIEDLS